ncbi:MAG: undecaprenyl-diphosphate phosphatase [Clostridia bacterium]|nr:undecaprenyl-diphosphate phosphatase [Clostridia bacterium]
MGALQGVAEFLPISSSGHLALFQHFFGMENYDETQMFFTLLLHFGTLISVVLYYWNDVWDMICEFFAAIRDLFDPRHRSRGRVPPARRLVMMVILGTLPLFVILPLKGSIEGLFANVTFVSCALIFTGFLLFFSDRMARGRKTAKNATVPDALLVGCAQAVAVCPGISRAGATISAGMLRGFDRTFAVRFSFLLSLPAVLGANILEIKDVVAAGGIDMKLFPMYMVGMLVSMVVGYFAIHIVNLLASKGKFGKFAYYCWVVGVITLVLGFLL